MTINSTVPGAPRLALWLALLCSASSAGAEVTAPPAAGPPQPTDLAERWDGERVSFSAAIERSLRQNPQTAIALSELARARALLEQVRAASLPTLAAGGTYTRLDDNRVLNGNIILGENQIGANLQLAVPLVQPRAWVSWGHAQDNVKLAASASDEVRRQLATSTARAYLTVLTQRNVVAVSRTARDAARAHHGFEVSRWKGGVGTRLDEVRAAQEQASAEAQLAFSRTQLARAREALGVLLAADGPVDAMEAPALDAREPGELGERADVRSAILRKQAAHRVTRDSFVDYLPLLSGVFQPFVQDPPSLTVPRTGWQAQLLLSVPLFDGGLRYGVRRERTALEQRAEAELQALLRQARSEVRVAFGAVREADQALLASRDAARLAQEALQLASTAYREGAATNLELIDAERHARDADTQSALAEDAARQARLDLLVSSGSFPPPR